MEEPSPNRAFFQFDVPLVRQRMTVEDGFATPEEALEFGNKACGAACIKMVLDSFGIESANVKSLMEQGIKKRIFKDSVGWIHKGMVKTLKEHGLDAERTNIFNEPERIIKALKENYLIIASVSLTFNPDKRGGHLVVIYGVQTKGDKDLEKIFFRDPSGWGQAHAEIDADSFLQSWSGNVILARKAEPGKDREE